MVIYPMLCSYLMAIPVVVYPPYEHVCLYCVTQEISTFDRATYMCIILCVLLFLIYQCAFHRAPTWLSFVDLCSHDFPLFVPRFPGFSPADVDTYSAYVTSCCQVDANTRWRTQWERSTAPTGRTTTPVGRTVCGSSTRHPDTGSNWFVVKLYFRSALL